MSTTGATATILAGTKLPNMGVFLRRSDPTNIGVIVVAYGRMFSLWMYAAIAPIPLSSFAGEPTSNVGKNFLRSYAGVCLQGVVIALACIIFSAVSSSPPAVDTSVSVVTAVWTYVGELAFNLLVLVGAVKGCDRIVKEIMGL